MSKRLLSVFLVLCMLASVFGTVAFASEPIYTTSAIKFGYVEGDAWTDATALEAGKTLTSKIEVSKTGNAENMIFALVVYEAYKLIDADSVTLPVAGDKVTFEASVELDDVDLKADGTYVVAVLWDNVDDMNAIANSSIFPGGSSQLASITLDGKPLENFDPEVLDYTYDVNKDAEALPVVEAKPIDGGAKVEIEEATDYPGKVRINVTAPGASEPTTYTISYSVSGKTGGFIKKESLCIIDSENRIPDVYGGGIAFPLPLFEEGGLKVGSKGYCDRDYLTTEIMDESLIGKDKIIGGIGWYNANTPTATAFKSTDTLPWVRFVLGEERGATVMVFFADKQDVAAPKFAQYGYEMEANPDGYFTNTLNNDTKMVHKYKFYRHYDAGEAVTVPNAVQGNNTYTIVLSYDPIGYVKPINHTALSSITIDGTPLEGFSEELRTYNYALPSTQEDIPVVEVTTLDPEATAVISNPTAFPGKTTVTVKCEGYEDTVYTINYTVGKSGNIVMLPSYNGETIKWDSDVAVMYEDLQNGKYCWSDRLTNANMVFSGLDDSLKGKGYIIGALNWVNGPEENKYKAAWAAGEFVPNFFTFDIGRTATIRVVTNVAATTEKGAAFAATGYDVTTNSNGYLKAFVTAPVSYNYMYTRKFEVTGDPVTVEMPNLGGQPYVVVIDYDTYSSLEGLTPDMIPSTELTTLTLNGVEIEGFSGAKTAYNVELTTQNIPVVAAAALYRDARVTVTQAAAIPGTATVTVEAEGLETAVYTINFTAKIPEGYVDGMSISNDNVEMRTTKRTGWNKPLNSDSFTNVYKKTIDVEEGSAKTITLEIANKPYQKGTIILRPTDSSLTDKTVLVNPDGSAIEWVTDNLVSRAYDYVNYPEYNVAGVTFGKKSATTPVILGSGTQLTAFKEMFADDNRYVSGARTHYTRYPINAGTAMGDILPEWEDCNYIVFNNYYGNDTQTASETVTFTVDKDVEIIFLTSGTGVTIKEAGVDSQGWTAEEVSGINRIYMNWIDSITVAYLIYNGYITEGDLIGTYGNVQGVNGILIRDRSAFEEFIADWKAEKGEEPIDGVQIKESDKAATGFVNDSATYHHDVFLYAWKEATGGGEVPPATSTLLSALTIDGKAVEGFASSKVNYTVQLPAYTDVKNVVATVADANAAATVDTATDGVIKVTVSADGAADTVYTVNYTLVNFGNIKMKETYNGSAINWGGAIAVAKANLQEGDLSYSDRSTATMVFSKVADEFKGKDWIAGALDWPNGGAAAYRTLWIDTTYYPDFYTFDLYKSAQITIVASANGKKAAMEADGWTCTEDKNGYLKSYTSAVTSYNYKYTKYVDVTDSAVKVSIPNVSGISCFVVIDFEAEKPEGGDPVVPPATAGATQLTALSVNGTAVAGFNADTYQYTVVIPDNQADFPEVAYTKADDGATVEVTNPTEFPGKAVITVSKSGEATKTYTITYKTATEGVLVSDLKLSDKAGITSASAVWPTTATNLQEGDLLYLGRTYTVTTINDESAKGKDRIMTAVGWGSDQNNNYSIAFRGELINDWISFTAKRGMDVVVYDDSALDAAKFTNLGYKHTTDTNLYIYAVLNANNYAKHSEKYVKHYNAGETVNIPNAANNQAYLVVLDYDNYESLEEDEPAVSVSTKLSAITVNGTAIAGFSSETLTYEVEVPAGTTSAVVAATAQDDAANVSVTQAAAVPGTATITVTAEGSEPTTYTINITKEPTEADIYDKDELTITDNDVAPRTVARSGWNSVIGQTNFGNKYTKEFTVAAGSTETVSLDITGLQHQQGIIIIKPTGAAADKNTVVNADGSALTWRDDIRGSHVVSHGGTIESYDYENYPMYDETGATWAKISSNKPVAVTFNGSQIDFPVMQKMIKSDGKFVNGARAQTDRRPADGAIHYTSFDESWLGCNYIVFDNTNRSTGFNVSFTINQSAEIILLSNNGAVTVKESGSDAAWAKQSTTAMREHVSPVDELTVAYMIYHGYLNENQFADVSTYADTTGSTVMFTGRRIKNLSAFRALQADLTAKYGATSNQGIIMVEANREATGFTDVTKDYSYKDYLYNWEDAEGVEPSEPVSTLLSAITVNGVAVEGFNANTFTYNVELAEGTTSAAVAATPADADATVTVTQAAALPGTATIVVTGTGSEPTTYTVNITVAEPVITEPVQNVAMRESYNGQTLSWGGTIAKYKTNLQVGDYSYSDRSSDAMKWTKVDSSLVGKDWIQGALDWTNGGETRDVTLLWKNTTSIPDYFTFELHKSAKVMVITETNNAAKAKPLTDKGYVFTTNTNNYLKGYFTYDYMYSKYVSVRDGEYVTVEIPNLGGAACTVVLDYDATPVATTTLSDLTVDGVTVEGFDAATNTYTVQIPAGSELPVVGYELTDENATAVVAQATEVPGTATVTVSGFAGQEDNVYTINFIEFVEKKISFSDLEARGVKTHTEGEVAVLYNAQNSAKYAFKKTYDVPAGETKTITLSAAGLSNQWSSIVVRPTEEGADKNVIVTADGGELTWKDYNTGVPGTNGVSVSAYDYQNGGDEEFDADFATYTQFSTDGVSVTYDGVAKAAWVVDKMHYSDNAFVNGAPSVTDRNPSQSGVCWVEFPAEWEDCNYITFPSDSAISGNAEITFTVNAPVEVILFTAAANATVKDAEDTENWAREDVSTIRRYMHGVDSLSIAYMIKKGYMKESDIVRSGVAFAGYSTSDNKGFYLRRYDALMNMEADFGGNYGVGIKAENLEATGFINEGEDALDYYIRDYTYQEFLDAWVDEE